MRFIGDVHGKFKQYARLIAEVPQSIQVGDMGVGFMNWHGEYSANPPFDKMEQGDHRYIRGNHDNPEVCRRQKHWIPDGTMHHGIFCLGGAVSIDRARRTQGLDWWPDEELSYIELDQLISTFIQLRPEIVVTHDCPESVASSIMMRKLQDGSRTRAALQQMWQGHQPKLWVFGHWHQDFVFKCGRTTFICLNELSFIDSDNPTEIKSYALS